MSKSSFLQQSWMGVGVGGLATRKELLASWGVSVKWELPTAVSIPEAGSEHRGEGNAPQRWLRHWMRLSFSIPPDLKLLQAAVSFSVAVFHLWACGRINQYLLFLSCDNTEGREGSLMDRLLSWHAWGFGRDCLHQDNFSLFYSSLKWRYWYLLSEVPWHLLLNGTV